MSIHVKLFIDFTDNCIVPRNPYLFLFFNAKPKDGLYPLENRLLTSTNECMCRIFQEFHIFSNFTQSLNRIVAGHKVDLGQIGQIANCLFNRCDRTQNSNSAWKYQTKYSKTWQII